MEQQLRKTVRKNSAILTAQLIEKLVDENLMQRYGTSLEVNMGREYQKYLDKKYQELKNEFDKMNKNSDEFISIEELTEFINTFSNEVYLSNLLFRLGRYSMKNTRGGSSILLILTKTKK